MGFFSDHAGVVHAVAGGEVVGAVDDDVVVLDQVEHVFAVDDGLVLDELEIGVEVLEPPGGGFDLGLADVFDAEEDLALEVAGADDIDVGQADRADARRGQVQADRATQPAGADAEHLGVEQFLLPFDADFRQDQVALVAVDLLGVELGDQGRRVRVGHLSVVLCPCGFL